MTSAMLESITNHSGGDWAPRFAFEVGMGIARVLEAPARWPEVEPGTRKYRIDRFSFGIFYRVPDAATVEIVALFTSVENRVAGGVTVKAASLSAKCPLHATSLRARYRPDVHRPVHQPARAFIC
jgi:hypothetical protein